MSWKERTGRGTTVGGNSEGGEPRSQYVMREEKKGGGCAWTWFIVEKKTDQANPGNGGK